MTSIDELCRILKAYSEGKTIEALCFDGKFRETLLRKYCLSELLDMKLRIKPEPREIWVVLQPSGGYLPCINEAHAIICAEQSPRGARPTKFREVLDE